MSITISKNSSLSFYFINITISNKLHNNTIKFLIFLKNPPSYHRPGRFMTSRWPAIPVPRHSRPIFNPTNRYIIDQAGYSLGYNRFFLADTLTPGSALLRWLGFCPCGSISIRSGANLNFQHVIIPQSHYWLRLRQRGYRKMVVNDRQRSLTMKPFLSQGVFAALKTILPKWSFRGWTQEGGFVQRFGFVQSGRIHSVTGA